MGGFTDYSKINWWAFMVIEEMVKMLKESDMREKRRILNTSTKKQLQRLCKALNISDKGSMILLIESILKRV